MTVKRKGGQKEEKPIKGDDIGGGVSSGNRKKWRWNGGRGEKKEEEEKPENSWNTRGKKGRLVLFIYSFSFVQL